MSIYTKIFATASIFAIAASALISPAVSAATGVTITGYSSSNPSQSLCLYGPGQTAANATVIASGSTATTINAGLPVQPLPNGSLYTIFIQSASSSCVNGTTLSTTPSTFTVYPGHMTSVVANGSVAASTFVGTVVNQVPYLSSNAGNLTINLCLGKTDAVTVEFTDPDGDNIQVGATPSLPSGMTYSTTQSAGKLTYTLYPSSTNTAVLGNLSTTYTLTAQEQANSWRDTAGVSTPATITFNVTSSCGTVGGPSTTVSSVVASSSVTALSTAATTSTAASAMAAKSSTTATVEVDAPSVGKGSATVRTGGAY